MGSFVSTKVVLFGAVFDDPDDAWPFVFVVIMAFLLQWLANYLWSRNSQVTRELLQTAPENRGSPLNIHSLMGESMMWTLFSTIVWICRITLVFGNNLGIFIAVLIGNLWGVYFTQKSQDADRHYLADDITRMLDNLENDKCNDCIRTKIESTLERLRTVLDKPSGPPSTEGYQSTGFQPLIVF